MKFKMRRHEGFRKVRKKFNFYVFITEISEILSATRHCFSNFDTIKHENAQASHCPSLVPTNVKKP